MAKRGEYMADAVIREWAERNAAEARERGLTVPCACGRWLLTGHNASIELCGRSREMHSPKMCRGNCAEPVQGSC